MSVQDFLPQGQVWLVWLVQALLAAGLIALLSGLIVRVVSAIPVVGPVLAAAVRMLFANYEKWLSERVPKLAEQAVLATEERWRKVGPQYDPSARAEAKLREAMEALQQMAPPACLGTSPSGRLRPPWPASGLWAWSRRREVDGEPELR